MAISVPCRESVPRRDHAADAPRRDTTLYDRKSRNDESADAIIKRSLAEVHRDQRVQEDKI